MSCGLWQNPQSCVASRIGHKRIHCQDTVLPQWFLYVVFQNHLTLQSNNRIAISCIVAQSCNGFIGCRQLALANIFRCQNNFVEQLCLQLSSCRTYFGNKITDASQVESIWPSAGFVYVRACQSCDDAKQSPALSAPEWTCWCWSHSLCCCPCCHPTDMDTDCHRIYFSLSCLIWLSSCSCPTTFHTFWLFLSVCLYWVSWQHWQQV